MKQVTKACPRCGAQLIIRVNGETGESFLGCQRYPECRFTQPLPTDVQLRLAGAPTLPGLDEEVAS